MTDYNIYDQINAIDQKIMTLRKKEDEQAEEIIRINRILAQAKLELNTTQSLLRICETEKSICEEEKNNLRIKRQEEHYKELEKDHKKKIDKILIENDLNQDETKFHCRYCYAYKPCLAYEPFINRYCSDNCRQARGITKRQKSKTFAPTVQMSRIMCDIRF